MSQLPPINSWHAASMRLTAFPVNPDSERTKDWWEDFVGSEPDSSTRKKLVRTDEGTFEGLPLQFTFDALRMQWERHASVDVTDLPEGFPSLGPLPESIDSFAALMGRWMASCPEVKRLAFGTVLLQPVESKVAGYRQLNEYISSVSLDEEASDFRYDINRRVPTGTGIDGLEINRLTRWSFMEWEIGLVARAGARDATNLQRRGGFSCRLELDINTSPEFPSPLPKNRLGDVWGELVGIAKQIAELGD